MTTFLSEHNAAPCSLYLSLGLTIHHTYHIHIYISSILFHTIPYHEQYIAHSTLQSLPFSLLYNTPYPSSSTIIAILPNTTASFCTILCCLYTLAHTTPPPVNRVEGVFYQTQLVHTCTMHIQHHHYHEWRVYFTKPKFARYFTHTTHTTPPLPWVEGCILPNPTLHDTLLRTLVHIHHHQSVEWRVSFTKPNEARLPVKWDTISSA